MRFSTSLVGFGRGIITMILTFAFLTLPASGTEPERLVKPFSALDRYEARASGEVRVTLPEALIMEDGTPLVVELAFQSMSGYRKALSLPKWRFNRSLQDFSSFFFYGEDGFVQLTKDDLGYTSFAELLTQVARPLCADVMARGMMRLTPDLWMAVSFRLPVDLRLPEAPEKADPGPTCQRKCFFDAFNDCDVYAIGGCGGEGENGACYHVCRTEECGSESLEGHCQEVINPGLIPNTCTCV